MTLELFLRISSDDAFQLHYLLMRWYSRAFDTDLESQYNSCTKDSYNIFWPSYQPQSGGLEARAKTLHVCEAIFEISLSCWSSFCCLPHHVAVWETSISFSITIWYSYNIGKEGLVGPYRFFVGLSIRSDLRVRPATWAYLEFPGIVWLTFGAIVRFTESSVLSFGTNRPTSQVPGTNLHQTIYHVIDIAQDVQAYQINIAIASQPQCSTTFNKDFSTRFQFLL